MKEYTKILADYAAGLKYEELPVDVVEQAKKIILHTIAVSIASSNMSPTVNAAAVAAARRSGPDATIWGAKGVRVSPSDAVYANGTAADVLDWEDCTWTGHASAGAIPASFAYGEQKHADGREVITAIVAAYEVYQRIAMAVQPRLRHLPRPGTGLGAGELADLRVRRRGGQDAGPGRRPDGCLHLAGRLSGAHPHGQGRRRGHLPLRPRHRGQEWRGERGDHPAGL